tara:strand:+ start:151 stop:396 length:246 start_codon:yes stop_codon:yes gene_type:complete
MPVKKKLGQRKYNRPKKTQGIRAKDRLDTAKKTQGISIDDVPLVKAPSGPDKKKPAQMRKQLTEMARMRTLRRKRRLSRGN